MKNVLITIVILMVIFLGGKAWLEHRAEEMLDEAKVLYKARKYQEAQQQLEELKTWYFWTEAVFDSSELQRKIEKRLRNKEREQEMQRAADREWEEETRRQETERAWEERSQKSAGERRP